MHGRRMADAKKNNPIKPGSRKGNYRVGKKKTTMKKLKDLIEKAKSDEDLKRKPECINCTGRNAVNPN